MSDKSSFFLTNRKYGEVVNTEARVNFLTRFLNWFFRSRETGKIVIVQIPNIPLSIFLVAAVVRASFDLNHTLLNVLAETALFIWSLMEIRSGDSPFRRFLGIGVFLLQLVNLIARLTR